VPGQVVTQPAAERRPDGRCNHHGDAVERESLAALGRREGCGKNGLCHRSHPAAGEALHHTKNQQRLQVPCEAAQQRAQREQGDADQKEILAPEHLRNPTAGAKHD
jgi:hypothetical protein